MGMGIVIGISEHFGQTDWQEPYHHLKCHLSFFCLGLGFRCSSYVQGVRCSRVRVTLGVLELCLEC